MPDWEIRQLETPESIRDVEKLQDAIWPGGHQEIVPVHMLLAASHNGGLVLGAYSNDRMIGMLFGFPGTFFVDGQLKVKHCSHMLGVHPEWRDSGLGFALKCAQRQFVLSQGINLVSWTYDPLLSRNAYLNIKKLGAVCHTYRRSEYGQMLDELNSGLDTDRFLVEWWLDSCRVEKSLSPQRRNEIGLDDLLRANVGVIPISEKMQPPRGLPKLDQPLLLIEIPGDILALKAKDFSLAVAWRQASREIFEFVFSNGFEVIDFLVESGRSFYILEYANH